MTQEEFGRELSSFDEKIQLAALEVSKAQERQAELEYQKARFISDVAVARCKAEALRQQQQGDLTQ